MKILLVEDDAIIRLLVSSQLVTKGHLVITANNGEHALEVLESNPDVQIIVTDIMMPLVSGVELVNELQNTSFKNIPAIAITGGNYLEENDGDPYPFKEVMSKPVYIHDLIDKINELVNSSSM